MLGSAMSTSSVTMGQMQGKLDTIGNNLANVEQTGFKRREASFQDLLFQQVNNNLNTEYEGGRLTPDGIRNGSGAAVAQTALRMDQGSIQETGRDLDFALTEPGHFFEVETTIDDEAETVYTREGSFYLSEEADGDEWNLVTANGEFLLDSDGERMTVPGDANGFSLQPDGTLQADFEGDDSVDVGEIAVTRVTRPQLLEAVGDTNFRLPDLDELGLDVDEAEILEEGVATDELVSQGATESANVDMTQEMTEMMTAQRNYSFNAQAVTQTDQMMQLINNLR
ncbi:flagellar hook-basal body protein [Salsuginibacillus kocurii]|uniref:flagellar hook-basal body protein n=1 Tax=Salsuginibacillus kocurii TaxID=427078 RepID=UPI00035ED2DC|nr:flagellar hook-basal body protein [Salsuginibacillus kocurii]